MDNELKKKLFKIGIPSAVGLVFCVLIPVFIPDLAIYFGFGPKMSVAVYSVFACIVTFSALYFTNDCETPGTEDAVVGFTVVGTLVALFVGLGTFDARYSKITTEISTVEIDGKILILDPPRKVEYIVLDSDLEQAAMKQNSQK